MPSVLDIFWSLSHFIQFPTFWTESKYTVGLNNKIYKNIFFSVTIFCHFYIFLILMFTWEFIAINVFHWIFDFLQMFV